MPRTPRGTHGKAAWAGIIVASAALATPAAVMAGGAKPSLAPALGINTPTMGSCAKDSYDMFRIQGLLLGDVFSITRDTSQIKWAWPYLDGSVLPPGTDDYNFASTSGIPTLSTTSGVDTSRWTFTAASPGDHLLSHRCGSSLGPYTVNLEFVHHKVLATYRPGGPRRGRWGTIQVTAAYSNGAPADGLPVRLIGSFGKGRRLVGSGVITAGAASLTYALPRGVRRASIWAEIPETTSTVSASLPKIKVTVR